MLSRLFNWKKTIHLVRGLPGEGKSTLAKQIVGCIEQVVENDYFWEIHVGLLTEYRYEAKMTHLAGAWGWAETFRRLQFYDEIAVANTFIRREHIFGYIDEAIKLGVNVKIYRPTTPWIGDVDQCFKTNVHQVPKEIIERMKSQWEPLKQDEIDTLIETAKRLDESCVI